MTTKVSFLLSDLNDVEEPQSRDFEVIGVDAEEFFDITCHEDGDFQGYIEEIEFSEGPKCGTIDMTADMSPDRTQATWYFQSCEIEDKDGFIADTVAKIEEVFGWKLKEV